MSQSFEDKLREKLTAHEAVPPQNAKGVILNQVRGKSPLHRWRGALLLLAILFLLGYVANYSLDDGPISAKNTERRQLQPLSAPRQPKGTDHHSSEGLEPRTATKILMDLPEPAGRDSPQRSTAVRSIREPETTQGSPTSASETSADPSSAKFIEWYNEVQRQPAQISSESSGVPEVSSLPPVWCVAVDPADFDLSCPEATTPEEVIEIRRQLQPYLDFGTFFLYQNMQPNTGDDVYITDFEGSGRFSRKRLGFILEGGARKKVNENVTLRLGTNVSLMNQHYAFNVRGEEPDSIAFSGEDPQSAISTFERASIEVSHQLWAVGANLTGDFYILPDLGSSLFSSVGYHHLLNGTQSFEFDGQDYSIEYPNQLLLTLGIRKMVWKSQRDQVYVSAQGRYSILDPNGANQGTLSVKPFSVGLTLSWTRGRFNE